MGLLSLFAPAPAPAASAAKRTRCECTGRAFADVASRMRREGWSPAEAERETTAGSLCTECLPDLRDFLLRHDPRRTS